MTSEAVVRRDGTASLEFVEGLHAALDELWTRAPAVPEADRSLFALAVIEIATNVVVHATDEDHPVTLKVELRAGDDLHAILHDDATPVPVDLTSVSMADALAESGRGLAIAAAVCDELSLERRDGNVWRLRRRVAAAG